MAQLEDALRLRGPEIVIYGAGNVAPLLNGHSHNVLGKQLTVHRAGRCPNGQMAIITLSSLCSDQSLLSQSFTRIPSSPVHSWSRWSVFSTWDLRWCVYPNLVIESVTVEPGGLGRGTEPPLETGNRSPTVEGFNPSSPVMMQLTPKLPLTPPPRISCRSLAITRARSSAPPPSALPPPLPAAPLASLLFCSISQFPYILLSLLLLLRFTALQR